VALSELKQPAVNGSGNGGLHGLMANSEKQDSLQDRLEEVERRHILKVLEETGWVLAGPHGAAARLGMKRSTLQYRMRRLGLSRTRQRTLPKPLSLSPSTN
jgi:transcriptional regulator with GAF, ATPase, and Fis domain